MFIALLGRQPDLSLAELSAVYGSSKVHRSGQHAALVDTPSFDITALGGTVKAGRVLATLREHDATIHGVDHWIRQRYAAKLLARSGKITLGISAYNWHTSPRELQKIGLGLKSMFKKQSRSLRLVPNTDIALSTAASHNNKLGLSDKKVELLLVCLDDGSLAIAESCGAQNITAYAKRDRERPRRDAFVGMLPPKLAQIMVNLAVGAEAYARGATTSSLAASHCMSADTQTAECAKSCIASPLAEPIAQQHILDPFCGTGTVLQEALLKGYCVHGSDLSQKMIDYTIENLSWLKATHKNTGTMLSIRQGDATTHQWVEAPQLTAVVCETYLGQPFSAPPKPEKLKEVVGNCNHIISGFLRNIHGQLHPDTPLCIAVPSWQSGDGHFTRLPLTRQLHELGYTQLNTTPLRYHRPGQVVARDILLLKVS